MHKVFCDACGNEITGLYQDYGGKDFCADCYQKLGVPSNIEFTRENYQTLKAAVTAMAFSSKFTFAKHKSTYPSCKRCLAYQTLAIETLEKLETGDVYK